MYRSKLNGQAGSAVMEFITFVLVGQMMIFGGSMVLAKQLSQKVEGQLDAINRARALALGSTSPSGADECAGPLVCTRFDLAGQIFSGLSYAN